MTGTVTSTSPFLTAEEQATFGAFIVRKGLKVTRQREIILEVFAECDGHIDIEELFQRVRGRAPGIGHATVYRTMKLLQECGLAEERHFGDGLTRYERTTTKKHHDHLICLNCGAIVEFTNAAIEALQEQVAADYGFAILDHKLELYGTCRACKEKGVRVTSTH